MKTKDILLVDDDIYYLHPLSVLLKSEGFDVSITSDGIKALEALNHNKFRIMITDFNMPKINGVELAAKVKEMHSDMRIVLVTGGDLSEIVEAAANAGISEMLSKPIELQSFLAVIRRCCAQIRQEAGSVHLNDARISETVKVAGIPYFFKRRLT